MSIQELMKVCPPPQKPIHNQGNWNKLEKQWDLLYPKDYKDIINLYGTGSFGEFLFFINPFDKSYDYKLEINNRLQAYNGLMYHDLVYVTYPNENGIFPLAATDNGDIIYSQVHEGRMKEDSFILYDSKHNEYEVIYSQLTNFIVQWLQGKYSPSIIEPAETTLFLTMDDIFNLRLSK